MDINKELENLFKDVTVDRIRRLKVLLRHLIEITYLSYDYFSTDEIDELDTLVKSMFSELYLDGKSNINPRDVKNLLIKTSMYIAETATFDHKENPI